MLHDDFCFGCNFSRETKDDWICLNPKCYTKLDIYSLAYCLAYDEFTLEERAEMLKTLKRYLDTL